MSPLTPTEQRWPRVAPDGQRHGRRGRGRAVAGEKRLAGRSRRDHGRPARLVSDWKRGGCWPPGGGRRCQHLGPTSTLLRWREWHLVCPSFLARPLPFHTPYPWELQRHEPSAVATAAVERERTSRRTGSAPPHRLVRSPSRCGWGALGLDPRHRPRFNGGENSTRCHSRPDPESCWVGPGRL